MLRRQVYVAVCEPTAAELLRQDSDHRIRFVVKREASTEQFRVAAKSRHPSAIADQSNSIRSGLILASNERSTKPGFHTENVKKIVRHEGTDYALGIVAAG